MPRYKAARVCEEDVRHSALLVRTPNSLLVCLGTNLLAKDMDLVQELAQPSKLAAGGDLGDKFNVAKEKKAAGDVAFKDNDMPGGAQ